MARIKDIFKGGEVLTDRQQLVLGYIVEVQPDRLDALDQIVGVGLARWDVPQNDRQVVFIVRHQRGAQLIDPVVPGPRRWF